MRFFLIVCLFLAFAQPVSAQTNATSPSTSKSQIDELLGNKKEQIVPTTIEGYAFLHYQQCMRTQHPILSGDDLMRMCTCTSTQLSNAMTFEQIKDIEAGGAEGIFQHNRMMLFVYAPCVKPTIRTMLLQQCMGDRKNAYLMKNQGKTCVCIADYVANKMDEIAPIYIQNSMRKPAQTPAPLDLLVHEDSFNLRLRHYTGVCFDMYEKR